MERDFEYYEELLDRVALTYNNTALMVAIYKDLKGYAVDLQDEIESDDISENEQEQTAREFIEYVFEDIL